MVNTEGHHSLTNVMCMRPFVQQKSQSHAIRTTRDSYTYNIHERSADHAGKPADEVVPSLSEGVIAYCCIQTANTEGDIRLENGLRCKVVQILHPCLCIARAVAAICGCYAANLQCDAMAFRRHIAIDDDANPI